MKRIMQQKRGLGSLTPLASNPHVCLLHQNIILCTRVMTLEYVVHCYSEKVHGLNCYLGTGSSMITVIVGNYVYMTQELGIVL